MTKPTLRERRRVELADDILETARRHLISDGAAALSLRAIARDLGMAVSALYRYHPSRDDLLTALLVQAFVAASDAVQNAVDALLRADPDDVAGATRAAFRAHRSWGRSNPEQFGLCYGTPVPGYAAPAEETIAVATRVPTLLQSLLVQAEQRGLLDAAVIASRAETLDPSTAAQLAAERDRRGHSLSLPVSALGFDMIVRVHGFVLMEVFGQLRPVVPDADAYFEETLTDALHRVGFTL